MVHGGMSFIGNGAIVVIIAYSGALRFNNYAKLCL